MDMPISAVRAKEILNKADWRARWDTRLSHIVKYGFPIYTIEVIEELVRILSGKRVVDVGCGTAFLARQLSDRGIAVKPVDTFQTRYDLADEHYTFKNQRYMPVKEYDATKLHFNRFDAVIMSWPDYQSDFSEIVVKRMRPGQLLVYQGEGSYGCTGNDVFHQYLYEKFYEIDSDVLNEHHVQFDGIHDWWNLYRKK
jgi:SAM-dependent methyltransferase